MFRRLLSQQGPSKGTSSSDPVATSAGEQPPSDAVEKSGMVRATAMARRGGLRARARGEAEADGEEAPAARPTEEARDAEDDVVEVSEDVPEAEAAPAAAEQQEEAGDASDERAAGQEALVAKEPVPPRLENRGTPSAFSPLTSEPAARASAPAIHTCVRTADGLKVNYYTVLYCTVLCCAISTIINVS